ncbi:hypothetical protein PS906_04196 [Pseudomonas fluorescens]|jgi:hypothetical protein|nr:hypothetical protein PS906_04196 [Pseudomonas fluorescens]
MFNGVISDRVALVFSNAEPWVSVLTRLFCLYFL